MILVYKMVLKYLFINSFALISHFNSYLSIDLCFITSSLFLLLQNNFFRTDHCLKFLTTRPRHPRVSSTALPTIRRSVAPGLSLQRVRHRRRLPSDGCPKRTYCHKPTNHQTRNCLSRYMSFTAEEKINYRSEKVLNFKSKQYFFFDRLLTHVSLSPNPLLPLSTCFAIQLL